MNGRVPSRSTPRRSLALARVFGRLAEGACAERLEVAPRELIEPSAVHLRREPFAEPRAVERIEQAELLREAIELLLANSVEGRLLGAAAEVPPDEARWRRSCSEEIGWALSSGTRIPGELLVCALQERSAWPSAERLAGPLLGLRSNAAIRATCARALFAAGRHGAARRLVARLELAELDSHSRAQLLAARAVDAERAGCELEALRLFERSASCGGGLRTHVAALLLALRTREGESVDWSLERLGSARPTAARRARALRELEECRALIGRPLSDRERSRVERQWPVSPAPSGEWGVA
jgi:hypothetical protein